MNSEMNNNSVPLNGTPEVANTMTDDMAKQIENEIDQPTSADNDPSLTELLASIAPGSEDTAAESPMMITATEPPTPVAEDAPRTKRKYTRRATSAKREAVRNIRRPKASRKVKGRKIKQASADAAETPVRKRRKKLSPAVRQIEHNVFRHVTREVRHTGVGWNPPILDPAWNDAVKRMEKDGLVVNREDMGGYVPKKLVSRFAALNNQVLAYVKNRFRTTGEGVTADRLLRARQAALIRLEKGGKVARTEKGFVPVEDLNAMEA